jgi:antitoxin-like ribbon-helix-helix protein
MAKRTVLNLRPKESQETEVSKPEPSETAARPDRRDKKLISGHFPRATWATLRILTAKLGKTQQQLLEESLTDLFNKHRDQLRQ